MLSITLGRHIGSTLEEIIKFEIKSVSLLKNEDKLHLGIKNELVDFILPSVCIIFALINKLSL